MGDVTALPRQPLLGATADALAKAKQVAEAMSGSSLGVILEALIGKKPEMVEDAAYGFPPLQGAGQTLGPKTEYAADIADLLPWVGAAKAGGKVAGAMAKQAALEPWMIPGTKAAQEGVLRVGGRPDLMLSHGGTLARGANRDQVVKELMHPSFAVTPEFDPMNPFAGSYLIPRVGAFDPAYSTSTLFNRDAYLARATNYPGGWAPDPRQRMLTRGLLPPPKTEGSSGWVEPGKPDLGGDLGYRSVNDYWKEKHAGGGHNAAIFSSPAFRSFKEYELSPKGAATLAARGEPERWSPGFEEEVRRWMLDSGVKLSSSEGSLAMLRREAKRGDPEARRLLSEASRAPSEYAELKVSGPVPLTGDRFAGAILGYGDEGVADVLARRGLEVETRERIYSDKDIFRIADEMQRAAGPVKEQSLRVRSGWQPPTDVDAAREFGISRVNPTREFKIEGAPVPSKQEMAGTLKAKPSGMGQFDSKEDAMKAAQMAAEGKANAKWLLDNPGAFPQPAKQVFGFEPKGLPGQIAHNDFSEAASAVWGQNDVGVFTINGLNFKVYPSGAIHDNNKYGTKLLGYLDLPKPPVKKAGVTGTPLPTDTMKAYDMGLLKPEEAYQQLMTKFAKGFHNGPKLSDDELAWVDWYQKTFMGQLNPPQPKLVSGVNPVWDQDIPQ